MILAILALSKADERPAYGYDPVNYQFNWEVIDDYARLNYGQDEARAGQATNGKYSVLLPDGRTQTVTYSVQDGYSGYSADVQYSGEAYEHASYKPVVSAYKPEPYKPVTYKPEPYKPVTYKPVTHKPVSYKPVTYKPVTYKPEPYKPAPYKPEPKYDEPLFRTHVKNVRKSKA